MSTANLRTSIVFSAALTGLLLAPGCDEREPTTEFFAAVAPARTDVVGISVAPGAPDRAALELADGDAVDLALGAARGADLLGACAGPFADADRTVLPVLTRPLVLGDVTLDEPVLEASCHAET